MILGTVNTGAHSALRVQSEPHQPAAIPWVPQGMTLGRGTLGSAAPGLCWEHIWLLARAEDCPLPPLGAMGRGRGEPCSQGFFRLA